MSLHTTIYLVSVPINIIVVTAAPCMESLLLGTRDKKRRLLSLEISQSSGDLSIQPASYGEGTGSVR